LAGPPLAIDESYRQNMIIMIMLFFIKCSSASYWVLGKGQPVKYAVSIYSIDDYAVSLKCPVPGKLPVPCAETPCFSQNREFGRKPMNSLEKMSKKSFVRRQSQGI
jgi:hypothetical protein